MIFNVTVLCSLLLGSSSGRFKAMRVTAFRSILNTFTLRGEGYGEIVIDVKLHCGALRPRVLSMYFCRDNLGTNSLTVSASLRGNTTLSVCVLRDNRMEYFSDPGSVQKRVFDQLITCWHFTKIEYAQPLSSMPVNKIPGAK